MAASPTRSRRIDVRVTEQQDALIREAASLTGETVTGFLLGAANERARELLDQRRHLVMSDRAFANFTAALDEPGTMIPELQELFALPRIPEQMNLGELRLELLTADHRLDDFTCGNPALDHWLATHALASQRADVARIYLAFRGDQIAGYLSLTTGSVRPGEAPKRHSRGMPRHPIPTILITRLAVDQRHQGQRFGSQLLAEALRRAVAASDAVAARLVVVDATDDDAAAFYRRWGFIDAPENPLRLFRKIADIRRSLTG